MLYIEDLSKLPKYGFEKKGNVYTLHLINEEEPGCTHEVYLTVNAHKNDNTLAINSYVDCDGNYYEKEVYNDKIDILFDLIADGVVKKTEALPCPFCGGMSIVGGYDLFEVGCTVCSASVRAGDKETALAVWNKRVSHE